MMWCDRGISPYANLNCRKKYICIAREDHGRWNVWGGVIGKKIGKSLILKKITGEFKSSTFFPAVVMIILENIVNSKSKNKKRSKRTSGGVFFLRFFNSK